MSKDKFIKNSAVVMLFIILGKFFAIIRDALVAAKFGATYTADIYNFSIGIVYLLTTISYGLTTTFIPINTDHINTYNKKRRNNFVYNVINSYSIFTLLVMIIMLLMSKYIVITFGGGFTSNEEVFNTSVNVVRIMVLSLIFVSLQSVITGVLQSHNEFYEPAAMSLVSNIVFIIYLVFLTEKYGIYGFAVATVVSFLAQLIINIPKYKSLEYGYKPYIDLRDSELRKMVILMLPVIISTSLIQLNNFINRAFAVNIYEGAVTTLDLSNKLNTLAYEVFAIGIAMVIYPTLAQYATGENLAQYKKALLKGISVIFIIMIPAAVAIGVLRVPLTTLLFKRGAFDDRAVNLTANALLYYTPAMIAYGLRDILNKAFYAVKDTTSPMVNSFIGIAINIVLNIFLVKHMGVSGLTFATSVSSILITTIMLLKLDRKLKGINLGYIINNFLKIIFAALIMGIIIFIINKNVIGFLGMTMVGSLVSLLVCFILGSLVYFMIIYLLRIEEFLYLINLVRNRVNKN